MLIAINASELITEAWNNLGFFLDKAVYGMISFLYNLFHSIASVRLLSSDVLAGLKQRVYLIIAVISLFIIIYSLLQIIINPDKGATGEYSTAKVIFNLLKATILILIVPTLFSFAFRFQTAVMKNNLIVRLVTGRYSDNSNAGSNFMVPVFEGFFYLNEIGSSNEAATERYQIAEQTAIEAGEIDDFGYFFDNKSAANGGSVYSHEYTTVTYKFPISTIAGIFVAYVLLVYCFDVAVRTVKLAFFEVISPFPILISIIPKQDKIFNNWMKNTLKTYFELFLRIFVLSLGAYLISLIPNMLSQVNISNNMYFLTRTFIILGIVMFIRKAPKLISDVFGIDMKNANMSLKDRLKDSGITALAGAGLGAAAYSRSTWNALKDQKLTDGQRRSRFIRQGILQSFTRGAKVGFQEGLYGGTLKGMGAASNYAVHTQKAYARGAGWLGVQGELLRDDFGFMSYYDRKKAGIEMARDSEKQMRDKALREASKVYDTFSTDQEAIYGFDAKTKANNRALEKFDKAKSLSTDQVGAKTSKTTASVKSFTQGKMDVDSFDITGQRRDINGNVISSIISSKQQKMSLQDINGELLKVENAYTSGNITKAEYDKWSSYYNGAKKTFIDTDVGGTYKLSDSFSNMNSVQIEAEMKAVDDAAASGYITPEQRKEYLNYYESKKKKLSKQNVSDAMLYQFVMSGMTDRSDVEAAIGNDYASASDEFKEYAETYCYDDYVAKTGDTSKSVDDFRFATHEDMKNAVLDTLYDGSATTFDIGRTNKLSELANAVSLYQEYANDDSVNLRYNTEGEGNDGTSKHQEVTGANSSFGEKIFKGEDDLKQANLKVGEERYRLFSKSGADDALKGFRVPKGLQDRFGEISSYDELKRFIDTVQEETKTINDKYNTELDYLKFLEPSKAASDNIKEFRKRYKGKRGDK